MASEWQELTVADVAAASRNALVGGPFGSNLVSADYVPSGVPVIRGQNMGSRWVSGEFAFVTEAKAKSLDANLARPGDLVFTQRGTLGQVALVPSGRFDRYLVSQSQMKLTVDENKADPLFLYYVFTSQAHQDYVRQHAIQTGVPHTNLGILRNTPISLPPLDKQRPIARILGALDDKIELNRRMNETLEGMGRALFKSWFVAFDPTRAKADGRSTRLPDSIVALFPDRLDESELGHIPHSWLVSNIGEIAEVIDCLHSKKPDRQPDGKPLLQLWNIRDDGLIDMRDTYHIRDADYQKWITRMEAEPGDCVITNVGRVGAVGQIPQGLKAALGRNMTGVRCRKEYLFPTFLLQALTSDVMQEEIERRKDSGTILDALNVRNIPRLRFVLPCKKLLAQFERLCRPLRDSLNK